MFQGSKKDQATLLTELSALLWSELGPNKFESDLIQVSFNEKVGQFYINLIPPIWVLTFDDAVEAENALREHYRVLKGILEKTRKMREEKNAKNS